MITILQLAVHALNSDSTQLENTVWKIQVALSLRLNVENTEKRVLFIAPKIVKSELNMYHEIQAEDIDIK